MKTGTTFISVLAVVLMSLLAMTLRATDTNAAPERIGIYDSRALAYANFWSEMQQRRIKDLVKTAKEAKAAGQTERFKELDAGLKNEREKNHLQVFSTAPVDELLAGMKERVALVQQEAGVSRLVSKWDEAALKEHKRAEKVEVTDLLLREFTLNEKQRKVVEDLRKQKPLPIKKAEELMRKGDL